MIETLVSGGILAAAGGLAFLAYNEPRAYGAFHWALMVIFFGALIVTATWNFASQDAVDKLIPFIDPKKVQYARNLSAGYRDLAMKVSVGAGIGILYLMILYSLPQLGVRQKHKP
jgi:hypothetical protein